ncbi:hypothetical protein [Qipengyuania flava]|uniref:hypothetical protein n=1 Tax=Qipengyuania flava TaxID=192812 RepID=UPI00321BACFC
MYFLIAAIWLVCFWEWSIGFFPISDTTRAVLTQIPEFVILIGVLAAQGKLGSSSKGFRGIGHGLDPLLLLFLFWIVISTLLTSGSSARHLAPDLLVSLLNIKALVRYITVFYLIVKIDWSVTNYMRIRSAILMVVVVQVAIGLAQLYFGKAVLEFFSPRGIEEAFGLAREAFVDRERRSLEIYGTFRNTISYAYLMMIGVIVILVAGIRFGPIGSRALALLPIAMIFASGSRIVLFLTVAIYTLYLFNLNFARASKAKVLFFSTTGALLSVATYTFILSLDLKIERDTAAFVFSKDYIEAAMNQRLGIISLVLPQLISDPQILFGFGADKYYIANYAISTTYLANYALIASLKLTLEDVYWVSLLLYFGIPGFLLFCAFLYKIYARLSYVVRTQDRWISEVAEIARLLLLLSIPLNFVNQAFEVQIFALIFWSFSAIALRSSQRPMSGDIERSQKLDVGNGAVALADPPVSFAMKKVGLGKVAR